tara:strand:+ start:309 stop:1565 length:1257 start_codon:yes stop_codon:yes gene_type:complete
MACKRSGVQIPSAPQNIMKSFLIETKELLLSQGIIAILAIIQVRIVAGNLGPEIYGNIGVYLGFVGLSFRLLSSRNADLILMNFKSTNKNFISSSLIFELILGFLSLVFVVFIFYTYYNFIPGYLLLYFFTRIPLNTLEVFKGVFTHIGNLKAYSLVESTSNVIRFILVVIFVTIKPSISSFFYALSFQQIIITIFTLVLLKYNYKNYEKKMGLSEYFKLSKSSFYKIRMDQAVGLIPTHLDVVVIGYFSNFYSAGIYRIAKKLVDPINYLIVAFSPWMLNKISSDNNYQFKNLVKRILIPLSILIYFFYYLFGVELINFIVGNEFSNSYTPMLILVIGYLSYFLIFWTRHYLFLNNLIHKHTTGRLINLSVFIIGSTILIGPLSFNGIAIAVASGTIIQKFYELYIYFDHKKTSNNT